MHGIISSIPTLFNLHIIAYIWVIATGQVEQDVVEIVQEVAVLINQGPEAWNCGKSAKACMHLLAFLPCNL